MSNCKYSQYDEKKGSDLCVITNVGCVFCHPNSGRCIEEDEVLADYIIELKAEQDAHNALKQRLKGIEWGGHDSSCVACSAIEDEWTGGDRFEDTNHYASCWLAEAIKGV